VNKKGRDPDLNIPARRMAVSSDCAFEIVASQIVCKRNMPPIAQWVLPWLVLSWKEKVHSWVAY